jgi:hypothetical protein
VRGCCFGAATVCWAGPPGWLGRGRQPEGKITSVPRQLQALYDISMHLYGLYVWTNRCTWRHPTTAACHWQCRWRLCLVKSTGRSPQGLPVGTYIYRDGRPRRCSTTASSSTCETSGCLAFVVLLLYCESEHTGGCGWSAYVQLFACLPGFRSGRIYFVVFLVIHHADSDDPQR